VYNDSSGDEWLAPVHGAMKGAYETFPLGMQLSHAALLRNLDRFVALAENEARASGGDLADFVLLFVEFLDVHHDGEDALIFPALRRHSKLRSTDAAALDLWTQEHRSIHSSGRALAHAAEMLRNGTGFSMLRQLSVELRDLLRPHMRSEDELLSAARLREMIPERELAATQRAIGRKNGARGLRLAAFLAHSLAPDEQRALLGEAPWLFRKVLATVGKRRMARFKPFVFEPAIVL
jgi:hemerythrin-like domain-containing protein